MTHVIELRRADGAASIPVDADDERARRRDVFRRHAEAVPTYRDVLGRLMPPSMLSAASSSSLG